ncbi:MAG: hypothetical protein OXB84_01915 [Halobacteriovoraceae bacterium]|nr:hypothetical protein [Halobacteriovoraceae bacterium]
MANGFNPLDIVENLQNAGIPEEQAKVFARVLSQVANHVSATKQDLEMTKMELKRDIEELRTELKRDIKDIDLKIEMAKKDLKIWVSGIATGGIGLLIALGKLGLLTP